MTAAAARAIAIVSAVIATACGGTAIEVAATAGGDWYFHDPDTGSCYHLQDACTDAPYVTTISCAEEAVGELFAGDAP